MEELDPKRRLVDPGLLHHLPQLGIGKEGVCLLTGGELVEDQDGIRVVFRLVYRLLGYPADLLLVRVEGLMVAGLPEW